MEHRIATALHFTLRLVHLRYVVSEYNLFLTGSSYVCATTTSYGTSSSISALLVYSLMTAGQSRVALNRISIVLRYSTHTLIWQLYL